MPDELTALRTHRDGLRSELASPDTICVLVDIDGLIWINHEYGHPAGDRVVNLVAAQMVRSFASEPHALFRVGGDEFLAVLHGATRARGRELGEALLADLRSLDVRYTRGAEETVLAVNVVVFAPSTDLGIGERGLGESLRRRAEDAIHRAKQGTVRNAGVLVELHDG